MRLATPVSAALALVLATPAAALAQSDTDRATARQLGKDGSRRSTPRTSSAPRTTSGVPTA